MKDTAGKIALGIIGAAVATFGILLVTLPKVLVRIGIDSDSLIYPMCVVYNKTSEHILIEDWQLTLDGITWDWMILVISVAPHSEAYDSPGWINPADYAIEYGLHRAYIKLRDQKGRIYKSNTISFVLHAPEPLALAYQS